MVTMVLAVTELDIGYNRARNIGSIGRQTNFIAAILALKVSVWK